MKIFILFFFIPTFLFSSAFADDDFEDQFADSTLTKEEPPAPVLDSTGEQIVAPGQEIEDPGQALQVDQPSAATNQTDDSIGKINTSEDPENKNFSNTDNSFFSESETLQSGEVVLEKPEDLSLSYKQRRSRHGILFSVTYEKFYPVDYYSLYRDAYVEEIIDTDRIDLIGAELGYKLNFKLGSISVLANYAQGSIKGLFNSHERNLTLKRVGASLNFAADNFFEEPWVVPYAQVGAHQFEIEEDDLSLAVAAPESATTQISLNYKFGLLFQLNWIEKAIDTNTQIDGLRSSGLQNTFLDVYMIDHLASNEVYDPKNPNSEGDPDLASGLELGLGFKMEF